jgi:hypothetical protein
MAKLRLLKTGHGDLCLAEWDPNRPETVAAAAAAFTQHFTAGRLAFRLDGPGRSVPIRSFDAAAPEILLVPAIQGGSCRSNGYVPYKGSSHAAVEREPKK